MKWRIWGWGGWVPSASGPPEFLETPLARYNCILEQIKPDDYSKPGGRTIDIFHWQLLRGFWLFLASPHNVFTPLWNNLDVKYSITSIIRCLPGVTLICSSQALSVLETLYLYFIFAVLFTAWSPFISQTIGRNKKNYPPHKSAISNLRENKNNSAIISMKFIYNSKS